MTQLVLSLFPGIGLLDMAFEQEGFCVVRGPDLLWGGDVRTFHPPAGKFDGIIGGDPCQSHSALANLVRAKGLQPRYPDLTSEYQRIVDAAAPSWFLRENVPNATDIRCAWYGVSSFVLDNSWLDAGDGFGESQMRRRRFWFGVRDSAPVCMQTHIPLAALFLPSARQSVTADSRSVPVALGGSGKIKRTRQQTVTARHEGRVGSPEKDYSARYTLEQMMALQGVPADFFGEDSPFTMQARRRMIGNGVPLPMGRAIARAVKQAIGVDGGQRKQPETVGTE